MARVIIPGFRKIEVSGGGEGGTSNYNDLTNKPSINNVPLVGNLNTVNLKLTDATLTEEGVPAEAKTVGAKLEEQSSNLTALSEQLGNHTVKSDVPENAVFTDTLYDDTEVKESISAQSTEMMDIKMLGWSVPRECPIQNEVNGNQFIQKVGRVDVGTLNMDKKPDLTRNIYKCSVPNIKPASSRDTVINGYCYGWTAVSSETRWEDGMLSYDDDASVNVVFVTNIYENVDSFKQAMQGQYLYYELAAPITITIDGNEIGETVSDVRKETTVNLLKPTLGTITKNGVTCTNNGDGTYTLNGTATSQPIFWLNENVNVIGSNLKLVCCPPNVISDKQGYLQIMYDNNEWGGKRNRRWCSD